MHAKPPKTICTIKNMFENLKNKRKENKNKNNTNHLSAKEDQNTRNGEQGIGPSNEKNCGCSSKQDSGDGFNTNADKTEGKYDVNISSGSETESEIIIIPSTKKRKNVSSISLASYNLKV